MTAWLLDRVKNVWFYAIVILGLGFGLYSAFLKPTTSVKIGKGGTYMEASPGYQPVFGCAIVGRHFVGWAHQKAK